MVLVLVLVILLALEVAVAAVAVVAAAVAVVVAAAVAMEVSPPSTCQRSVSLTTGPLCEYVHMHARARVWVHEFVRGECVRE